MAAGSKGDPSTPTLLPLPAALLSRKAENPCSPEAGCVLLITVQEQGERDFQPLAGAESSRLYNCNRKLEGKKSAFSGASGLSWDLPTRSPGLREIRGRGTNCREESRRTSRYWQDGQLGMPLQVTSTGPQRGDPTAAPNPSSRPPATDVRILPGTQPKSFLQPSPRTVDYYNAIKTNQYAACIQKFGLFLEDPFRPNPYTTGTAGTRPAWY